MSALTLVGARDGRPGMAGGAATVGLRAVDGIVTELGPGVAAGPGDVVLDGDGLALVPGFVNGHGHAAMTLFRSYGSDLALMTWLETMIWPAEARLTADDVYWGTRLACLEMVRSGTLRCWDMYWHPLAVARAARDAGMRATVGLPLIDALDPSKSAGLRAEAVDVVEAIAALDGQTPGGSLVAPSFAPHGIYTVSAETLAWVAEESAARALPVQLHFLEEESEVRGCLERTGKRPGRYLEELGLLSPRTVLAHGCWLEDDDLVRIAAAGATVVTNPVSNLKLATGRTFPYPRARAHGVAVGIGTDGASSNNSLDLLQDVKYFALLQKAAAGDPAAVPATEAFEVATGASAPALGGSRLEVGAPADFVLVRTDAPELNPGPLVENLVYAGTGAVVDTSVVHGRVLMRGRSVEGAEEVVARAREAARRLGVA